MASKVQQSVAHIDRMLRLPTVKDVTGKPKATIYRDMALGLFPKCVRIGARAVAWRESDISAWLAERASCADATSDL